MTAFESDRDPAMTRHDVPLSVSVTPIFATPTAPQRGDESRQATDRPAVVGIEIRAQGALTVTSAWQVKELELTERGFGRANDRGAPTGRTAPHVELDLSGVTEIDAAGVAAVVFLARSAQADGYRVHIVEPTAPRARTFVEMTGVFDLLNRRPALAA